MFFLFFIIVWIFENHEYVLQLQSETNTLTFAVDKDNARDALTQ